MILGVLGALSSLLGFTRAGVQVGAANAGGIALQDQASELLTHDLGQNMLLQHSLNRSSREMVAANAMTGQYMMKQNAQVARFDAQCKIANKWMQLLGAMQ